MPSIRSHVHKYKCPCGKSYFTVNSYHDKAGQFDEYWEMNCSRCRQHYQLSSLLKETGGGINETYMWAPVSLFSELAVVDGLLKKAQEETLSLAREMYLEKWIMYCCRGNSKRGIWRKLSDDGRREPDFGLFDQMVNDLNICNYLKEYFQYHNLDYILKKLGARDARLNDMKGRINGYHRRLEKLQGLMRMEGFNGCQEC